METKAKGIVVYTATLEDESEKHYGSNKRRIIDVKNGGLYYE